MREPLEKEHVFQTPERRELHDLFQVLGKCYGHRLQVVRNLPIAVIFFTINAYAEFNHRCTRSVEPLRRGR